jgi:hypothetical protein
MPRRGSGLVFVTEVTTRPPHQQLASLQVPVPALALSPKPTTASGRSILRKPEETEMPDDLKKRGAQDQSRISMSEEHEVRYWTKALGVTKEKLAEAVSKVGHSVDAVRRALGK